MTPCIHHWILSTPYRDPANVLVTDHRCRLCDATKTVPEWEKVPRFTRHSIQKAAAREAA